MEEPDSQVRPAQPPIGIYSSRCDDKGRLRLPKEFEEFLKTLPVQEFFVTSLDGNSARIYSIDVWRENEKVLEQFDDPVAAEAIAYAAHYYGGLSGIDTQGRILVPPVLRRKIGIENAPVNMRFYNGALDVFSEAASERLLQRAADVAPAALPALKRKGLR